MTAFTMTVLNGLDRLAQTSDKGVAQERRLNDALFENRQYIRLSGKNMPEIRNWH